MNRIVLNETSYYGAGCRSVIADEIKKRGYKKVLLVTDKDLIRFGVAAKIEEVLADAGIPYEIYSEIKANPTIQNVKQGIEAFKKSGADCMVALGGGSSIDTAKAIGIIVNNPEFADVRSLEGVADTHHKAVPTFAVPTTAGTAAEVTINYVITDEENKKEDGVRRPERYPDLRRHRLRIDDVDAQRAHGCNGHGCADARHRKLHHARSVDDERHVRGKSHRVDSHASLQCCGEWTGHGSPQRHGRSAIHRRHGILERGTRHRTLDGPSAGCILRHSPTA